MRKAIAAMLMVTVALGIPAMATAGSNHWGGSPISAPVVAVVSCAVSGSPATITAQAASVSTGGPTVTTPGDCATAISTILGAGLKLVNVVQGPTGWTYTFASFFGED